MLCVKKRLRPRNFSKQILRVSYAQNMLIFLLTKTENTFDSQIVYYTYVTNKKLDKGFRVKQGQKAAEICADIDPHLLPTPRTNNRAKCMHACKNGRHKKRSLLRKNKRGKGKEEIG